MSETPIPILTTGRTEAIGRQVTSLMKPEYEGEWSLLIPFPLFYSVCLGRLTQAHVVIHFTFASSIMDELPYLLKGGVPPNPSSTLGSGNWSSPPQALLIGGAYQDKDVEEVVRLAEGTEGAMEIPWLRIDSGKMQPPSGQPTPDQAAAYGKAIVQRFKDGLHKLKEEGKLGLGKGGIYLV